MWREDQVVGAVYRSAKRRGCNGAVALSPKTKSSVYNIHRQASPAASIRQRLRSKFDGIREFFSQGLHDRGGHGRLFRPRTEATFRKSVSGSSRRRNQEGREDHQPGKGPLEGPAFPLETSPPR